MYTDGTSYFGTHFYWDDDENEYILCAKWKFEKGYDIPDSWHLQEVEVESYNAMTDNLVSEIEEGDDIWRYVENEGPAIAEMTEVD